jgi:hypothetical protein
MQRATGSLQRHLTYERSRMIFRGSETSVVRLGAFVEINNHQIVNTTAADLEIVADVRAVFSCA